MSGEVTKGEFTGDRIEVVSLFGVSLVERLRTDLEAQILHGLNDMVVAFEHQNVLIADGVVALLVVQIHQRGDLREFVSDVLQ